jgi:nucleoside-diphosphate kinase
MERTFAIIKPNAVKRHWIGKIINMMEEDGLYVVAAKMKTLTKTEAEGFYAEHKERPFFGSLVSFMTSGPVVIMALEADNAVEKYRKLMGATNPANAAPGTIRKAFGESLEANSVHGSDSATSAARELKYMFGSEL